MANAWVEFVRKWSKDNNETYSCAVSLPACREAYQKTKPPKKAKKLTQKQEREAMGAEDVSSTAQRTEATASLSRKKASIDKGKTMIRAKQGKRVVEKQLVETLGMMGEDRNVAVPKGDVVAVRPRGRPKKYATAEEAKEAKATKTVEAKKKRQALKKEVKAQKKAKPLENIQMILEETPSRPIVPVVRVQPPPAPPKQKLDPVANAFGRAVFEEAQARRNRSGNLEIGLEKATELIDFVALVITDLAKPYANDLELSPRELVDRTFSNRRPFRGLNSKTIEYLKNQGVSIINETIFKDSPFEIYSIKAENEYNEDADGVIPEMTIKMDKEVDWDEVSRLVLPIATNKGLWSNIRKALVRVPFKSRTQQLPDSLLGRISEYLPARNTGYYLGETEESKVRGIKDITRNPLFEEMSYKQAFQRKARPEGTPNEYYDEENKRLGIPISSGIYLLNDQSKLPEIKEVVKATLEKALNNKLFVDYARDKKKSKYPSAFDLTTKQKETVLKSKEAKALKGEYAKKIDDATSPKQIADILKDLLKKQRTAEYSYWSLGDFKRSIYDDTYAIIGRKGDVDIRESADQMPIQQSGRGRSGGKSPCMNGKELKGNKCVKIGGAISNPEINNDWFHNYAQRLNQPLINYKGLADSIAHPNIAQVRDLVGKINGLIG